MKMITCQRMNKPKRNDSESCKSYILAMVWRVDGFIEKRVWSRSDGVRGMLWGFPEEKEVRLVGWPASFILRSAILSDALMFIQFVSLPLWPTYVTCHPQHNIHLYALRGSDWQSLFQSSIEGCRWTRLLPATLEHSYLVILSKTWVFWGSATLPVIISRSSRKSDLYSRMVLSFCFVLLLGLALCNRVINYLDCPI